MAIGIENLAKSFQGPAGAVQALADVSLRVEAGQFVAVQGPSGCGKTTLLLTAGGLLRPDGGRVLVDGQNVYSMSPEARARFRAEKIGFVFQQFHLVPYLTVLENILTPVLAHSNSAAVDRARELARRFQIEERIDHVPAALSTGERQRAALARALLNRPKLLLADEPTGNLDEKNGEIVLNHLGEFAKDGGAVLLVTHDPRAGRFANRLLKMQGGRIFGD